MSVCVKYCTRCFIGEELILAIGGSVKKLPIQNPPFCFNLSMLNDTWHRIADIKFANFHRQIHKILLLSINYLVQ